MSEIVKPFTPAEALARKSSSIPREVIQAVNELLAEKISKNHTTVTIKQQAIKERVLRIIGAEAGFHYDFFSGSLDFESLFEEYGWHVSYDKPAYNETYDAYFEFKPKK